MATIKGIFEPFAEYVQEQLNLRKKIISNSKGNKIISNKRYEAKPELFHAYANEKQSIIRMMSGVDIRTDKANPELFEIDPNRPKDAHVSWDETYLKWKPSGFARQYILEGGTRYYDDKIEHGWRGGFTTGKREDEHVKGKCNGSINYTTGAITLLSAPPNAEFVISANYGSAHSGGVQFGSAIANSIHQIKARSCNQKIDTLIEVIGLH